jgi:hypothetical protein
MPTKHLRPSDLRAAAALATQATHGIAHMTEAVHQSVLGTLGAPAAAPGRTGGLTGFVYRAVHGVTALVGKGLQSGFVRLEPMLETLVDAPPDTPQREAVLAALNGVLGDRLADDHNPLATPMTLRAQRQTLPLRPGMAVDGASGKIMLFMHGLCMNDLQWQDQPGPDGDPWQALAAPLGYTPVYLRYNSGRHISQNGRELAGLLAQLLAHWPVAVRELTVVAHSMGGLVMRSAIDIAQGERQHWPSKLKNIFFLGTPHHGAPLERAGNWIDLLLGSTPFSAPFAKLGQLRSAGITDLRHGFTADADWLGRDRFRRQADQRQPMPLPAGVTCHAIAATMATRRSLLAERLLGDGLVPLRSALGQHDDPRRVLAIPPQHQWIAYRMNHMQLLHNVAVVDQLRQWLTAEPGKTLR